MLRLYRYAFQLEIFRFVKNGSVNKMFCLDQNKNLFSFQD